MFLVLSVFKRTVHTKMYILSSFTCPYVVWLSLFCGTMKKNSTKYIYILNCCFGSYCLSLFKKNPTFSKWSCVIHRVNFFEFWTVALTNTTRFLHFHKKSHHHGVISSCQSVVIQLLRIFWWFLTGLSQKSVWSRDTTCISPSGSYNYANAVIIRALCSCFS